MFTVQIDGSASLLISSHSFNTLEEAKEYFESYRGYDRFNALLLDPTGEIIEGYKNW